MAKILINGEDASAGGINAPKEVPLEDKGFSPAEGTLPGSG